MSLRIQFIEENKGYVNVKEGAVVPLNLGAADVRDFTSKKGAYSQKFELVGSKENAVRMNRYFDVNIIAGTFNVSKRQRVNLIQNGVKIGADMYLQLKDVKVKNDVIQSYEVVVKDVIANLFTEINTKELTDLNFGDNNHQLTAANIISTFGNTAVDIYKYHLTTNDNNEFLLSQFKPAIFAFHYWDRIIRGAGFDWEWLGMDDDDTRFSTYLIPCNNSSADSTVGDQVSATLDEYEQEVTTVSLGTGQTNEEEFIIDTEIEDLLNLYDPVTGVYTSNLNYPAGSSLLFNLQVTFDLRIRNNFNGAVTAFGAPWNRYRPFVGVIRNGGASAGVGEISTFANINSGETLNPLETKTVHSISVNLSIPCSGVLDTDQLTTALTAIFSSGSGTVMQWQDAGLTVRDVDVLLVLKDLTLAIKPNSNSGYLFGQTVDMNRMIPKKAKQSDFIRDIMTMANLWVYIDESNPNKLIFENRDKYLDKGKVKDWSKKKAQDRESELKFLSDLSKKKTLLTYKSDKDELNAAYEGTENEIYGQVEYTYESEFVRDVDKKELTFSPTPSHSTTFGAIVPAINGIDPKMNIRVLLDGGVIPCQDFTIQEAPPQIVTVSGGYPYVGHFDNPLKPTLDINFAVCDFYFYPELQVATNNGLFNLNWRRTLNAINKGKMLTALFWLDEYDVQTFKTNDKLWVDSAYWHVNKITAYNANKRQLTKVELFPVDDEVKIPFQVRTKPTSSGGKPSRPIGIGSGTGLTRPVQKWIGRTMESINSVLGLSSVKIIGKNNVVLGSVKNTLVVGDGLLVDKDGITAKVYSFGDGVYLTSEGVIGAPHNLISAGVNEVLNEFSTNTNNLVTGGVDAVRGLGSNTSVNKITAN